MKLNRLLFAHALIILPDRRVLLRKLGHHGGKWTATIEKGLCKADNPCHVITEALAHELNINLDINQEVPKVTIRSFDSIIIQEYNRKVFPFIIETKQILTLKSDTNYQFSARPFTILSDDIMNNAVHCSDLSKIEYTLNTVHVIRGVHLARCLNLCSN